MHTGGEEILIDEARDALIRPHLGIQPSTATSHRRSAEVQQHGFPLRLGVLEDLIHIMAEIDFHTLIFLSFVYRWGHITITSTTATNQPFLDNTANR